jgi:hypothetical protein
MTIRTFLGGEMSRCEPTQGNRKGSILRECTRYE